MIVRAIIVLLSSTAISTTIFAAEPDWLPLDRLLSKHIYKTTIEGIKLNAIHYGQLADDPDYGVAISLLDNFDPALLSTKNEKLAYYINAYNLLAIKVVLDNRPLDSIKDAGGLFSRVWSIDAGKLGGKVYSLDEIEHEILRTMGEPRIHFAIVCASLSCPDIRTEAYRAEQLDDQLEQQASSFINNPTKGIRLTDLSGQKDRTLHASKIFDWFEDDFDSLGGVRSFVLQRLQGDRKINPTDKVSISTDIPYNWNLNGDF